MVVHRESVKICRLHNAAVAKITSALLHARTTLVADPEWKYVTLVWLSDVSGRPICNDTIALLSSSLSKMPAEPAQKKPPCRAAAPYKSKPGPRGPVTPWMGCQREDRHQAGETGAVGLETCLVSGRRSPGSDCCLMIRVS
jgi:hypothetical protein